MVDMQLAKDEVDEIVDGWRDVLPDVDFDQKTLVLRVLSTASNLEAVAAATCADSGLDLSLYKILSELRRAMPVHELKPKELIRCLPISSGGLTSLIDRAEAAGFASRRPDPNDRRGVVVALTDKGKAAIEAAARQRAKAEDEVLAVLTRAERDTLNDLLRRITEQFSTLVPR